MLHVQSIESALHTIRAKPLSSWVFLPFREIAQHGVDLPNIPRFDVLGGSVEQLAPDLQRTDSIALNHRVAAPVTASPEIPAPGEITFCPVIRHFFCKEIPDQALFRRGFTVRLLHGTGCKLDLAGQIQAFAALPAHFCFCPDLCNHVIREVRPYLFLGIVASHVDGPETAVSRGIPEKGSLVARSEEHTPPGQLLHIPAIRGAVTVSPQTEELLDAGNIR